MKTTFFLAGALTAVASAVANPVARSNAVVTNDPNAPCGTQAFGAGGVSPTESDFNFNSAFQLTSLAAFAPSGYTAAFRNQTGASQQGGYAGFYFLQSYNTSQCASYCNSASGCTAFNIYYERDPLLNPADACPNPSGTVNIKCALYSQSVSQGTATNQGQFREQFHVLIAGSDGFNHQ